MAELTAAPLDYYSTLSHKRKGLFASCVKRQYGHVTKALPDFTAQ